MYNLIKPILDFNFCNRVCLLCGKKYKYSITLYDTKDCLDKMEISDINVNEKNINIYFYCSYNKKDFNFNIETDLRGDNIKIKSLYNNSEDIYHIFKKYNFELSSVCYCYTDKKNHVSSSLLYQFVLYKNKFHLLLDSARYRKDHIFINFKLKNLDDGLSFDKYNLSSYYIINKILENKNVHLLDNYNIFISSRGGFALKSNDLDFKLNILNSISKPSDIRNFIDQINLMC